MSRRTAAFKGMRGVADGPVSHPLRTIKVRESTMFMSRCSLCKRYLALFAGAAAISFLAGCTQAVTHAAPVDPLAILAERQKGSFADERAAMLKAIRDDVRQADPSADSTAFENALSVVGSLPREEFVPRRGREAAYVDLPQSIGYQQTISAPNVVTIMTAELRLPADAKVLDVGTGSGYQAAVLARIARRVYSVEIVRPLAVSAAKRLRHLGFLNVEVRAGDGFLGWPQHAPFDGIIVAASATSVPPPLIEQLKIGARLIMPVGATDTSTQLLRFTKRADGSIERCSLGVAFFVPLTGGQSKPFSRFGLIDRSIPLCYKRPIFSMF